MARYRGPVEKLERRLGVSLAMKGERRIAGKNALDKRPYAPGQHGQKRGKISDYGSQLREKQKAKFCLLYTSPSPRDRTRSRMPSSA